MEQWLGLGSQKVHPSWLSRHWARCRGGWLTSRHPGGSGDQRYRLWEDKGACRGCHVESSLPSFLVLCMHALCWVLGMRTEDSWPRPAPESSQTKETRMASSSVRAAEKTSC